MRRSSPAKREDVLTFMSLELVGFRASLPLSVDVLFCGRPATADDAQQVLALDVRTLHASQACKDTWQ